MAKYTSPHAKLGFYVNGVRKRFSDGEYETDNADEIAALALTPEVIRIDSQLSESAEVVGGDEVKTDVPVAVDVITAPESAEESAGKPAPEALADKPKSNGNKRK